MFKVKVFFVENGNVQTTEKIFADMSLAIRFFSDIQTHLQSISHAKLICHRRVVDEF